MDLAEVFQVDDLYFKFTAYYSVTLWRGNKKTNSEVTATRSPLGSMAILRIATAVARVIKPSIDDP